MTGSLRLLGHVQLTGAIRCVSGLRIGGSNDDLEIGTADMPIIRNPLDQVPYLPGSSLKGKLRALAEYREGKVDLQRGEPHRCSEIGCMVCTLFGPHKSTNHQFGPSRLLVRDGQLTPASRTQLEPLREAGLLYAEVKRENWIDRRTGVAGTGGLRSVERVPAGSVFTLRISMRVFDGDDRGRNVSFLRTLVESLPREALGGSGSRGYGEVEIQDLKDGYVPFGSGSGGR